MSRYQVAEGYIEDRHTHGGYSQVLVSPDGTERTLRGWEARQMITQHHHALTNPGAKYESEWVRWADERPTDTKALYRWRIPTRKILGKELRPEWSEPLRLCGMGYADNEWWPGFSDWNGYRRTLPAGTEWRLAHKEETEKSIFWGGFDLKLCPFTGKLPTIGYLGRYIGAPPYRPEWLSITSYLVHRNGWYEAQKLQDAWNTRA